MTEKEKITPLRTLFGYAFGEGATALTIWSVAGFGMLFYTQILGMNAALAGLALSITLLWDAVTDPVMGFLSDNTRSRWGRRHPFVLLGGIALVIVYFLIWRVPLLFSSTWLLFTTVLVLNLMLRTVSTVYVVPYAALGFEICTEYADRSRLQGVRLFLAQIINLFSQAGAWAIFFRDRIGEDGSRIDGGLVKGNYMNMSAVLGTAALLLVISCVWSTRRYAADNRHDSVERKDIKDFFQTLRGVFSNRLVWPVLCFFFIAQLGMFLWGILNTFNMIYFMEFSANLKTLVMGLSILAFALASLGLARLVRRFEKKTIGFFGILISAVSELLLFGLFRGGMLTPESSVSIAGTTLPLGIIVFTLFTMAFQAGWGLLVPLTNSMIADVSEVDYRRTGHLRDGSYAAVLSFCIKLSVALGNLVSGGLLAWAGIVSGAETQSSQAVTNISSMAFLCGPVLLVPALLILMRYPVNRAYMQNLQKQAE